MHEYSDPELSIDKERNRFGGIIEAYYDSWHKVADYYEVANTDAKTLDSNRRIEQHCCVWICDLG